MGIYKIPIHLLPSLICHNASMISANKSTKHSLSINNYHLVPFMPLLDLKDHKDNICQIWIAIKNTNTTITSNNGKYNVRL